MPKVNNTDIYNYDEYPSLLDYLFGTKLSEGKKNKSYRLNSIIQLINGVNGKNNLQYAFSDGSDPEVDYFTKGYFFTDTNEGSPSAFTKLVINKESLQPLDLTSLFTKMSTLNNLIIKLENPADPNNFFRFNILNIQNETNYFIFDISIYNDFYFGELINDVVYSVYFDISLKVNKTSDLENDGADGISPFITSEDLPDLVEVPEYTTNIVANQLILYKDGVQVSSNDLSLYLDDTNLARIIGGTIDPATGIVTFTRDDDSTFTIDFSSLIDVQPTKTSDLENDGNGDGSPFATIEEMTAVDESLDDRITVLENYTPTPTTGIAGNARVIWTGIGYVYDIVYDAYYINGVLYPAGTTRVTLTASDATNDRIDVFALDATGGIVLEGIPSADPQAESVDAISQIYVTLQIVSASTTEPVSITHEIIYKENTNWAISSNTTIDPNYSINPFEGTKSIRTPAFNKNQYVDFTHAGTLNISDYTEIGFRIRLNTSWANGDNVQVMFVNGPTFVSNAVSVSSGNHNFSRTLLNTYQYIIIPINEFNFTTASFDRVRITRSNGTAEDIQFDNIVLSASGSGISSEQKAITSIITDSGIANATTKDDTFQFKGLGGLVVSAIGKVISFAVDFYTKTEVDAKDTVVLSDANAYTDSVASTKLNITDYNNHFKGVYLTFLALNTAHPTANPGDYAQVNEVGATDVLNYNWDAEENIWVPNATSGSGATNTDELPEGSSNLYFTTARVLSTLLTGISFAIGGAVVSTDSVLGAFGKLQKQINDLLTAISLKQDTLVTGTNIKTLNGESVLGLGDLILDPLVGGVIFLSNSGNDATARIENRNKPFKTLNAAVSAFYANSGINYIEIIDTSSYILSSGLQQSTKDFTIKSELACTVTITFNGIYITGTKTMYVLMEKGTLNLSPTTAASFGNNTNRSSAVLKVKNIAKNALFGENKIGGLTIDCENLTVTGTLGLASSLANVTGNYIKARRITFTGVGANLFSANDTSGELLIDFDSILHDNVFELSPRASKVSINHGNISSSNGFATWFDYCKGSSTLNINFKIGATITSNVGFYRFGKTSDLIISGRADYSNSDVLIRGKNTIDKVRFTQAYITCKSFLDFRSCYPVDIEDSTIIVKAGFAYPAPQAGVDTIYQPLFRFVGTNYILGEGLSEDFNLVSPSGGFTEVVKPEIDLTKAVLYTNGKFNRDLVKIIEKPLNQYYDTIQRQLVLVDEKQEIVNKVLDPTKTYVVNGGITLLAGEYIEVPAGGLTITGYGYDTSGIIKNVTGESIFKSPVANSGNLTLKDCLFNSGSGKVFDLIDVDGSHAIELNDINFQNCSSLGLLNGYRQFTGTTCGIYNCLDGITLEGNWTGFKMSNSNAFSFGASGTLIKKGSATSFTNRLYLDLNLILPTGAKICDFSESNFISDKLLQVTNSLVKVNGVIDPSTTASTFPNISPFSTKSYFANNIGIKNSFNEPYGLKTSNLSTYANDSAAATGGIQVGEVYVETSTGYFKTRLT